MTAILAVLTVVVLALAYAALDDLTTNPQPSYTAEYVWLVVATAWMDAMTIIVVGRPRRGGALKRRAQQRSL